MDQLKPSESCTPHWMKDLKQFRAAVVDTVVQLIHGDKKALFNLILLSPSGSPSLIPLNSDLTHIKADPGVPKNISNASLALV